MNKNVIGIISSIVAIIGLAFVSSWLCLFPLGIAFTMGVIGLFGGKDKDRITPLIGMLASVAGILIMCQFAGFIPTFGFKPIGITMKGIFASADSDIDSREDALNKLSEMTDGAIDDINLQLEGTDYQTNLDGLETDSSELADGGRSSGGDSIVGVWKFLLEGHMIVYNFYDGGSGVVQSDSAAGQIGWTQNGNNLKIEYYNEQGLVDESEEYGVEVSGDTLNLTKADGSVWSMERMSSLGQ